MFFIDLIHTLFAFIQDVYSLYTAGYSLSSMLLNYYYYRADIEGKLKLSWCFYEFEWLSISNTWS